MDKKEFLEDLRQSLSGEVSSESIEQNIKYYDQYISSKYPKGEEEVIRELGSPRLIARTIIETEKIAEQRKKGKHFNNDNYHSGYDNNNDAKTESKRDRRERAGLFSNLSWRTKLTVYLILILFIVFIIVIGRIIIGILFTFGIPILLLILVLALLKKR